MSLSEGCLSEFFPPDLFRIIQLTERLQLPSNVSDLHRGLDTYNRLENFLVLNLFANEYRNHIFYRKGEYILKLNIYNNIMHPKTWFLFFNLISPSVLLNLQYTVVTFASPTPNLNNTSENNQNQFVRSSCFQRCLIQQ